MPITRFAATWCLPLIFLLLTGFACAADAPPAPLRVALLCDDLPGLDRGLVEHLRGQIGAAGMPVTLLSAADLADPARFDRTRQDALVLTNSPAFPGTARANVQRFLEAGGHLVLLGGFAYSTPVCKVRGQWRDRAAFAHLLADLPATQTLFSFEESALAGWQRGTNHPEHPSTATLAPGPTGQCLRLDLRDLGQWQWDTFATNLPTSIPPGNDLLCFRARAGENTPEVLVEIDETDGSRWTLNVPLAQQWARYALEVGRFKFLKDASPSNRGGATDHLDLAHARRLSFGLATGLAKFPPGDHRIEIDDVGVAHNDLGATSDDFRPPNTVCFDTYEPYVLRGVQHLAPTSGLPGLAPPVPAALAVEGLSAVGFTLWDRSELIPLLQACDGDGRVRGWAASALVHYGGSYKGGCWLLSGVTTPAFYRTATFGHTLTGFLRAVGTYDLPRRCNDHNDEEKARPLGFGASAREGLTISPDGHFMLDGKRFFMVGADYIGSLDRKFFGGPWQQWLARDFAAASSAGVNCLRIYGGGALYRDPDKLAALKGLARAHGLYLLIVVGDHANLTREGLAAHAREVATAFADEPMVLGYDLQNEPYLYEVAKVKDGEQTLGDKYPDWKRWGEYEKAAKLGSDQHFTAFPGVTGPLSPSAEWAPVVQAASNVFGDWMRWQIEAIRSVDKTHPISVGYNSVFATLPCNAQLDFISHHAYEKPVDLAGVTCDLTTMDRLHALWPGKPIALGEFGYTNGMLLGDKYLDLHTSAVGEFLHYLYAFNQGYEGCLKWVLTDHPLELSRQQCSWMPPDDLPPHIDQGRYGLFYSDGTATPQPKPLVSALHFLWWYQGNCGERGELKPLKADNPIGTGYVFRAPHALFVGNTAYKSEQLQFTASQPANVLMWWDSQSVRLVSTADADVQVKVGARASGLSAPEAQGKTAAVSRHGDWLNLRLLEGEVVTLQAKR